MDHSHDQVVPDFYLCVCAHVCMHDSGRKGERKQGVREKERKNIEEGQMEKMEREKTEGSRNRQKIEGAEREDIVIQLSKQDVKHTQNRRFWAN